MTDERKKKGQKKKKKKKRRRRKKRRMLNLRQAEQPQDQTRQPPHENVQDGIYERDPDSLCGGGRHGLRGGWKGGKFKV